MHALNLYNFVHFSTITPSLFSQFPCLIDIEFTISRLQLSGDHLYTGFSMGLISIVTSCCLWLWPFRRLFCFAARDGECQASHLQGSYVSLASSQKPADLGSWPQNLGNPYPPDALPGGRVVHNPYAHIQVFEWGPESGEKVLLIPGIATPVLSMSNIFDEFVARGYRVMTFGKQLSRIF